MQFQQKTDKAMVKMSGQNLKCYNISLQCTTPLLLSLTCKLSLFEQNCGRRLWNKRCKENPKRGFQNEGERTLRVWTAPTCVLANISVSLFYLHLHLSLLPCSSPLHIHKNQSPSKPLGWGVLACPSAVLGQEKHWEKLKCGKEKCLKSIQELKKI